MVDTEYVKKSKRKKRVRKITAIASFCIATFVTVSMLSTFVGSYSIGVKDYQSRLAISETEEFDNPSTYLKFEGLKNAVDYSYRLLDGDVMDSFLDTEVGNGIKGQNIYQTNAFNYFSYTFYLSNVGSKACEYYFSVAITARSPDPTSGLYLDDVLRIRVYENVVVTTGNQVHNYVDYTKANTKVNDYTTEMDSWVKEGKLNYFLNNEDGTIINTESAEYMQPHQKIRFTLVLWLEANDPECAGERGNLSGAGLTIGTTITGAREEE